MEQRNRHHNGKHRENLFQPKDLPKATQRSLKSTFVLFPVRVRKDRLSQEKLPLFTLVLFPRLLRFPSE